MPTALRFRNSSSGKSLLCSLALVAFAGPAGPAAGQGVIVTPAAAGNRADRAYSATLLPSGGLFAAGAAVGNGYSEDHAAAIYLLLPAIGTPTVRTTYYNTLSTSADADYATSSVAVGNDVVTAGVAYTLNNNCPARFVGNFAITWWNANGAYRKVETAFSPDKKGRATSKSRAVAILRAADGSLVAVGEDVWGGSRLAVARYDAATGALLSKKMADIDFLPKGAVIQGNRVLAAGRELSTGRIALVRTNLNGNVDTSWGVGGKVVIDLGSESAAEAVAVDAAGRILVAGSAVFTDREAVLVRLNADGSVDSTFNGNGYVAADLGGTEDVFTSVNLRANGLIVAAGYTSYYAAGRQFGAFAAAQYRADGGPDSANFGVGGVSVVPIGESALSYDAKVQADGRVVLVGEVRTVVQESPRVTNLDFGAVQLDLNGRP